jgi:rhodanese-related sulfurtransferase
MYADRMSGLELELDPGELQKLRERGEPFVLLDVREPWEVATAHLPESTAMPMGDVPARAYNELDPEHRIVALCHHGVRSLHVAAWLRREGFEQAQSLRGGIDRWSAEIDPSVPRY